MVINFQAAFAESAPPATAPLLELGKIEEWDGTKLKKRESEIRELVIILAGKCIAILLEKLSKCQEAQLKALEQTCMMVAKKDEEKRLKKMDNFNNGKCGSDFKFTLCSGKIT